MVARKNGKRGKQPAEKVIKVLVERHRDGYVAYPLGLKGVVIGQGDNHEQALADVKSAVRFHVETFGRDVLNAESPVLDAYVAEVIVDVLEQRLLY